MPCRYLSAGISQGGRFTNRPCEKRRPLLKTGVMHGPVEAGQSLSSTPGNGYNDGLAVFREL